VFVCVCVCNIKCVKGMWMQLLTVSASAYADSGCERLLSAHIFTPKRDDKPKCFSTNSLYHINHLL
jgi:hypothetical protein